MLLYCRLLVSAENVSALNLHPPSYWLNLHECTPRYFSKTSWVFLLPMKAFRWLSITRFLQSKVTSWNPAMTQVGVLLGQGFRWVPVSLHHPRMTRVHPSTSDLRGRFPDWYEKVPTIRLPQHKHNYAGIPCAITSRIEHQDWEYNTRQEAVVQKSGRKITTAGESLAISSWALTHDRRLRLIPPPPPDWFR